jgi:3-hydroxyacyl-[acyl-carrier-protein] dehydratase
MTSGPVLSPLPHAFPFLLLDRVLTVDPGRWAAAVRRLTFDDPLLDAGGELPAVLVLEAMAQTAGVAAAAVSTTTARFGFIARVQRFRCLPPFVAGEELLIVARVVRRFGANLRVHASVRTDTRRRAGAALVLHLPEV